ncbi:MAG: RNA polymerase sigma factor [Actinomycetota bacterium]|nr:RNA polymerase sigma factor [Actinomycetota bacterium]
MPTSVETIAASAPLPLIGHGRRARSELALIRGAQAGSEADLAALFHRHWPRAYRAAFLIVHDHAAAEDIAQEAFLSAIRHLDRFDRRRRFAPWLGRIVVNRAIDWARARSARRETADAGHEPVVDVDEAHSTREYSPEVLSALAKLAPDHRAVVVLRHVLEFTPGEIARALELPRGTVNSRLRRGLDALEADLREDTS